MYLPLHFNMYETEIILQSISNQQGSQAAVMREVLPELIMWSLQLSYVHYGYYYTWV
jgi:hypothetical protein